jgi:(p)ppGpp synthase/HD superfamily hydrolase
LKDPIRAKEKIDLDPDPEANYSWLTDIAAGRVIYDNLDDFYSAVDNIVGNYQVIRLNERVIMPLETNYRDVLINLRMSNGHIVELQVSLKEIIEASDQIGHLWYEEWRTLNGIIQSQQGGIATVAQVNDLESLMTQMQNLYNDAYQQILNGQ